MLVGEKNRKGKWRKEDEKDEKLALLYDSDFNSDFRRYIFQLPEGRDEV
ncbi:MAG: hypothetical protein OP8BY_2151 [Candidatus Saccharicenans subterraneus]|jgi:hypothetical protein|uniref:Uncharacterized protein n=1 Tax=Candidatus Saccharicenans subterraneus TaxID=2508984 RepID=A0A3E2BN08_9BACT|nr:MAG: hypothetical protein OP8BY_2151 [Candidatus Saccharicenans subterraneum]